MTDAHISRIPTEAKGEAVAQPKKIVLYNPAVSSINLGDHIIADAAKHQLRDLTRDAFVVEYAPADLSVHAHLPEEGRL